MKIKTRITEGRRIVSRTGQKYSSYIWNLHNPNDKIVKGDGNCIHHKDEDKLNDDPSNLQKLNIAKHSFLHNKGKKASEESRKKMSISQVLRYKNKPISEETRKRMSVSRGRRKPISEETRRKMSIAKIGNKNSLKIKLPEEIK